MSVFTKYTLLLVFPFLEEGRGACSRLVTTWRPEQRTGRFPLAEEEPFLAQTQTRTVKKEVKSRIPVSYHLQKVSMKPPPSRKLQVTSSNDTSVETITAAVAALSTAQSAVPTKPIMVPPPGAPTQLQENYSIQPFDASMALTVLILLVVLFFMGFFSIYIRRFSTDPITEYPSHRRRRHRGLSPTTMSARAARLTTLLSSSRKGLDPEIIKSLPAYSYSHSDVKYNMGCAICLCEFEGKECVKLIPKCKHLFHSDCIDTWLEVHVSCPVCRETQFFEAKGKDKGCEHGSNVKEGRADKDDSEIRGRSSTMDNCVTIEVREVAALGLRRSRSSSSLGQGMLLQRTSSL